MLMHAEEKLKCSPTWTC